MNRYTRDFDIAPKVVRRNRIYAWTLDDPPAEYQGLIKVGETQQEDVNKRILESQGQVRQAYTVHLDEFAEREDGSLFSDTVVRQRLIDMGFENPNMHGSREWMRCGPAEVKKAVVEIQKGLQFTPIRDQVFSMREEQHAAVEKTAAYFQSEWTDNPHSVPRFLWNAKMRFGKTFTTYQLAKKLAVKRVLVVTFKPAVADSWKSDLESHVDFEGWHFLSSGGDPRAVPENDSVVYFGSFQDLLGRDPQGQIKSKNEWIHQTEWDLVVFDEYHFGAWRDTAKELFEDGYEDDERAITRAEQRFNSGDHIADLSEPMEEESSFLPIKSRAYLYLSGTPFKALASGEFDARQIYNWTYTDEQRAKKNFALNHPHQPNPYAALPQMYLMTYQLPENVVAGAYGEHDEFDLNFFFEAKGRGADAEFRDPNKVNDWLKIIRGDLNPKSLPYLKGPDVPPFPYSDVRLLQYTQHTFWFLPSVAACHAMKNLLTASFNKKAWGEYEVVVAAGSSAGIGLKALPPVRAAIGNGQDSKTITLSCGKLTTGVTVRQWSSILMLRNLNSPETYFQAAFRVQSAWSIRNPDGKSPNEVSVIKPACFVFDFAPTRALRQVKEYGIGLSKDAEPSSESGFRDPELAVDDLISYLPVLAFDGSDMMKLDAGDILDIAMSGTSAKLLARRWESALLVNVDTATLRKVLSNKEALEAVERIEGWRSLGDNVIETIINKSDALKKLKKKGKDQSKKDKKELKDTEKEFKAQRKRVQQKLIKFATRIPAFMYLTDFRENTLEDVITKIEPDLFETVTGLTVAEFRLLVSLNVFNTEHMNTAVSDFRRYEDASLRYTGIDSHEGLTKTGLWSTVVEKQ